MRFLEELPHTITVMGVDYPICTDFRDWIKFEELLKDKEISDGEKAALMLDWVDCEFEELPPPCQEIFDGLFDFFLCGESPTSDSKEFTPVFEYEQDMPLVYSAFVQSYDINILYTEYLHWWEFRALLDSLPEDTKLTKIIGYRAVDTSKFSKDEKKRYDELKRIYAIKGSKQSRALTLEERNKGLIERAKSAKRRAEMDKMP